MEDVYRPKYGEQILGNEKSFSSAHKQTFGHLKLELPSNCTIRYTPSFSYLWVSLALYSLDINSIKLESILFLCRESTQRIQILATLWTANCSPLQTPQTKHRKRGKCNATTTILFHRFFHYVFRLATEGKPSCSMRNVFGWRSLNLLTFLEDKLAIFV